MHPSTLTRHLLIWYHANKREMPWRGHPDPYAVWVSEIMLQQTQVATVMPYFERFMKLFPSVHALARADEERVLGAWQGLGYYTRGRNLHSAARIVVETHGGKIPRTAEALRSLPGIGPYTAAAIASIAFGERIPVIDGNVQRVVARMLRLDADIASSKAMDAIAQWLAPMIAAADVPGDFNQAMMELGALVCTPRDSQCTTCPWKRQCKALQKNDVASYPKKAKAKTVPTRHRNVCIVERGGKILFVKNTGKRFLKGMWDLPECDGTAATHLGTVKHTYSHFKLVQEVYTAKTLRRSGILDLPNSCWLPLATLSRHPLSQAPKLALNLRTSR